MQGARHRCTASSDNAHQVRTTTTMFPTTHFVLLLHEAHPVVCLTVCGAGDCCSLRTEDALATSHMVYSVQIALPNGQQGCLFVVDLAGLETLFAGAGAHANDVALSLTTLGTPVRALCCVLAALTNHCPLGVFLFSGNPRHVGKQAERPVAFAVPEQPAHTLVARHTDSDQQDCSCCPHTPLCYILSKQHGDPDVRIQVSCSVSCHIASYRLGGVSLLAFSATHSVSCQSFSAALLPL